MDTIRLHNLAMIQGIINRLALTSVALKVGALLLAAIIVAGCWINAENSHFHVISIMIVVVWWLDGFYLQQERNFRALHKSQLEAWEQLNDLRPPAVTKLSQCCFSKTQLGFYLPLLLLTGLEFLMH